jgi:hypothetical protein
MSDCVVMLIPLRHSEARAVSVCSERDEFEISAKTCLCSLLFRERWGL